MASAAAIRVASLRTPGLDGAAPVARPNLTIITGAHAMRVVFDGRRAMGIAYRRRGRAIEVRASREVLLCGGGDQLPSAFAVVGRRSGGRAGAARHPADAGTTGRRQEPAGSPGRIDRAQGDPSRRLFLGPVVPVARR